VGKYTAASSASKKEKMEAAYSSKTQVNFTKLNSVTSQKILLFYNKERGIIPSL
jgi:hypothetical protein